ncbi:MAG: hypothetical protein OXJ37_06015 [Bryobacterales bacterium]|nr:hypothetical protein [Bryobacterales bacterium]
MERVLKLNSKVIAILVALAFSWMPAAAHGDERCSDRRISANAIRTLDDVRAFVECAKQYLDENGPEESLRAFNEAGRWKHGSIYVFVVEISPSGETARRFVFPPDPSAQGKVRGESLDDFGTDLYAEIHRIMRDRGSGWTYYSNPHPVTGKRSPKASYLIKVDWKGSPAVVGAGLYAPDVPGTCHEAEVSAAALTANPNDAALRAFVRCASMVVESKGYLAKHDLEGDPRWKDGTSYAFLLDAMGNQVITGNGLRVNGNSLHEWLSRDPYSDQFGGRNMVDVVRTFGESFIYYRFANRSTGGVLSKVGFFEQVVSQGVPLVVGAGYQPTPGRATVGPGCSDNYATAAAVRTRTDVRAFVQCAAEYALEHGEEEARRAFNEDERWKEGPTYVFVDGVQPSGEDALVHVFPPEPSREGSVWGTSVDSFGSDYYYELHRILSVVDEGWIHYAFTNPETRLNEPKSSYVIEIDWNGGRAAIGAGIYERDLPGTCDPSEVNALLVEVDPNDDRLQEFVRCAANLLESGGYFTVPILTGNPRWKFESVYVFGIDPNTGEVKFSGNPASFAVSFRQPELLFGGRDLNAASGFFGETFWYYKFLNPATGMEQSKVAFVRLVQTSEGPILVGSGYNP